jgi:uncharacterized membrane protein YfcA
MSILFIQVLFVGLIFFLAGGVKGVVGMGLPTIAIGLLGLFMVPVQAAALLIIPSLITNVWQAAAGPHGKVLLRRLWPMLLSICVVTLTATGFIAHSNLTQATALGMALVLYGAIGLAKVQVPISGCAESWLSPVIGGLTGIITGATGVFVIPAAPYLQALKLDKKELVQALGISFTTSTLALAAGLASHGAFHLAEAGFSSLCTLPAILGMFAGQRVRARVDPATFRLLFFVSLLILGSGLILEARV